MSAWVLPEHSEGTSRFVVEESIVNLSYLGFLQVDSLAHQLRFQVIFIAAFDNKVFAAVPRSAWNRKSNQRIIPTGWFTKMTSLESGCSLDERDLQVEDLMVRLWVGFMRRYLQELTDFSSQHDLAVEYVFDGAVRGPCSFLNELWQMRQTNTFLSSLRRRSCWQRGKRRQKSLAWPRFALV